MAQLIKAILVDDEQDSLRSLQLLLQKHCPEMEIAATFTNPKEALKKIPLLAPELLFLDVQMPGLTGFELLAKLKNFGGSVIFVSAYSDYAVKAFKFSALEYLLKPVDVKELKAAVGKFGRNRQPTGSSTIEQLLANIDILSKTVVRKIAVSTQDGIEIVLFNDISYLKADRNYTVIKRQGKKDIMVAKTLKDFEEALPRELFMRIHTSYLINLQKIERYVKADGGYVEMNDGAQITVSQPHKEELVRFLKA